MQVLSPIHIISLRVRKPKLDFKSFVSILHYKFIEKVAGVIVACAQIWGTFMERSINWLNA